MLYQNMTKLENREAIKELRNSLKLTQKEDGKRLISLCAGSGCGAYGTAKVHKAQAVSVFVKKVRFLLSILKAYFIRRSKKNTFLKS